MRSPMRTVGPPSPMRTSFVAEDSLVSMSRPPHRALGFPVAGEARNRS
jgi:hypothetical protein